MVLFYVHWTSISDTTISFYPIASNLTSLGTHYGELEIASLNNAYLRLDELKVELLGRGMAWLDTGTHEGLLEAAEFVSIVQKRQGLYISCIEEIAYRNGWISKDKLLEIAKPMLKTDYGRYLTRIAEEGLK